MSDLINLIYASSAKHDMSEAELLDILAKAREKNASLNITGMLLYRGGNFLQVLEGERDVVKSLYETIAQDSRHRQVGLILERPIAERQFPNWEMGFQNLDGIDPESIPGYSTYLTEPFDSDRFREASFANTFLRVFKENVR